MVICALRDEWQPREQVQGVEQNQSRLLLVTWWGRGSLFRARGPVEAGEACKIHRSWRAPCSLAGVSSKPSAPCAYCAIVDILIHKT